MNLLNKIFIFECNSCESTLAGTEHIIQRYLIFGHPRVVEIKQKARPRYTLNNLKDDRIFLFNPIVATHGCSIDKGTSEGCTLIHKIIGSCKSGRHRLEGNSKGLLLGAFSLFLLSFILVIASVLFSFFFFSFKIFTP